VLIDFFSLGVTAEALYERISIENWRFRSNRVSLGLHVRTGIMYRYYLYCIHVRNTGTHV